MRGELPAGWAWATLGDVTEPVEQRGPGERPTFCYIDIGAVDNGSKRITDAKVLAVSEAPSRARQNVRTGDVLVSMTRPNLNAVALVPESLDGAVASTGFHVLRGRDVEPAWLFAVVTSPAFVSAMTDLVQGALYPAVRAADVREYRVAVPPLAEQRRIVAKLDKLLANGRAAREALEAVPRLTEDFRRSLLTAAVTGDLTEDWRRASGAQRARTTDGRPGEQQAAGMPALPATWSYMSVAKVAQTGTVVTYGIVLPGPEVPNGVPYVRQQDIEDGRVKVEQLARTSREIAAKHERSALLEGDVLLCIIRHLRVAVVPPGIDGANLTQGTVRIRPADFITADYLAAYLAAPPAQHWMKRCYIGMAMPRINVKDARAVPVAVPPLAEQREIMRRVKEALQVAERQAVSARDMLELLNRLEQAALAKAFLGELVPQDPSDEPATALLERVRGATPPARAPRRPRAGARG